MLRVFVQILYGGLCAVLLVAYLSYFRLPKDPVWLEAAPLVIIMLSVLSLIAFFSKERVKYLILGGCSGCLLAMSTWTSLDVAVRVADRADHYSPSRPELLLYFLLVTIPMGMLVVAVLHFKSVRA